MLLYELLQIWITKLQIRKKDKKTQNMQIRIICLCYGIWNLNAQVLQLFPPTCRRQLHVSICFARQTPFNKKKINQESQSCVSKSIDESILKMHLSKKEVMNFKNKRFFWFYPSGIQVYILCKTLNDICCYLKRHKFLMWKTNYIFGWQYYMNSTYFHANLSTKTTFHIPQGIFAYLKEWFNVIWTLGTVARESGIF